MDSNSGNQWWQEKKNKLWESLQIVDCVQTQKYSDFCAKPRYLNSNYRRKSNRTDTKQKMKSLISFVKTVGKLRVDSPTNDNHIKLK